MEKILVYETNNETICKNGLIIIRNCSIYGLFSVFK